MPTCGPQEMMRVSKVSVQSPSKRPGDAPSFKRDASFESKLIFHTSSPFACAKGAGPPQSWGELRQGHRRRRHSGQPPLPLAYTLYYTRRSCSSIALRQGRKEGDEGTSRAARLTAPELLGRQRHGCSRQPRRQLQEIRTDRLRGPRRRVKNSPGSHRSALVCVFASATFNQRYNTRDSAAVVRGTNPSFLSPPLKPCK